MENEKEEIELDLDNYTILTLALEAHRRDITLNKMVELVLTDAIKRHEEQYDSSSKTDTQE